MTGLLWYKKQTLSQSMYYTIRSVTNKSFKMRPDIDDIFKGEYIYPLEIMQDTIPFLVLQPSSTVLHVGFDKTYFDTGMSHPLIEAAIVGENGMIRCIDPDLRNINTLNSFAESHDIKQMMAIKGAVWNCNEDLEFAFDSNWGPMSGALKIPGQYEYSSQQSENRYETIQARQIDELVPEIFGDRPLDFLAITANGAEPQILEGAKNTLKCNPRLRISMALSFKHFSFEIRKQVCNRMMSEGWNVVVSNSLHDPWHPNVFLWCNMVRESQEFMEMLGASQVTWEQVSELALNESTLVRNRADHIRMHICMINTKDGLFKRGLKKIKKETKKLLKV